MRGTACWARRCRCAGSGTQYPLLPLSHAVVPAHQHCLCHAAMCKHNAVCGACMQGLSLLEVRLSKWELRRLLSGPYDECSAVVQINAGAGGGGGWDGWLRVRWVVEAAVARGWAGSGQRIGDPAARPDFSPKHPL